MHLYFSAVSKRDLTLLALLAGLILLLPIILYLAQQRQDIRPRAKVAQGPAKFFMVGPANVEQGQSFSVDLYVDTAAKNISGVEAHLTYPTDLLEIENATQINTLAYPVIIQNTAEGGNIDIAAGISPDGSGGSNPQPTATPTPATTAHPIQVLAGTFKSRESNIIRQIMFKNNSVFFRDVSYETNTFPPYTSQANATESHLATTGQGDIQAFASFPKNHNSDEVRQILVRGNHVYFRDINYVTSNFPAYQQLPDTNEHLAVGSDNSIQAMDGTFKSRTSDDIRQILIKDNHIYYRDVNYSTNSFPAYQQVSEPNEHLTSTGQGDIQAFASYVKNHNSDEIRQILVRGGHVYFRDVNYVTNSFPAYQQLAEPNEHLSAGSQ